MLNTCLALHPSVLLPRQLLISATHSLLSEALVNQGMIFKIVGFVFN